MSGCIAWLARNPVAANLTMALIVASGLLAVSAVKVEVFPEIKLDRISIRVPYPGAGPEEVESGVVDRVEGAVYGIDGIRKIVSTASDGNASVIVDLEPGADSGRVIDEIRNNIDAIDTFPAEARRPSIRELMARNQVANVAISGPADISTLKALAEEARDNLAALPVIALADLVSAPQHEISIEVSEAALRQYGFTFDQFADAVRRSSLDLPGGSVQTGGGEVLLRTVGQAYRGRDYEDLVLWTRPDGSRLAVGDVATVVDGFAEAERYARFDGDPAIMVAVFRTGGQNALEVADARELSGAAAGGDFDGGLAERGGGALGPALADAPQRHVRSPARLCGAGAVPAPAAGILGRRRNPRRVPRGRRPDSRPWGVRQRHLFVRIHPGARGRG